MATSDQNLTVARIDRLFRDGTLTSLRDGQLLERYLSSRDEAAFEALVNLHGPMVLGLCRRMLRDPRDIEDAFQATFLVLVRKAPALRNRDLVANWLYGVAYRVAVRARANLLRRKSREVSLGELEAPMSERSSFAEEYDPGLDQELNRLPLKYRVPIVLCYLKGMTHDQAAEQLDCPVGTVRSRLARGKDLLRGRLVRRGYDPSLAPLAMPLPVTASLLRATVEAAAEFTSTRASGTVAAASAVGRLAGGVLLTMTISKFKIVGLTILAMALTSGGVIAIAWNQARLRAEKTISTTEPPSQVASSENAKQPLPGPRKVQPGDWLQIEVLEALPGRPISGARIVRPDGTVPLGFYGEVQVAGLDRNEIKIKVVNHLRTFLTDEVLGLLEVDPNTNEFVLESDSKQGAVLKRIKPSDTDRVFVDDSVASYYSSSPAEGQRLDEVERRLNDLSTQIDTLLPDKGKDSWHSRYIQELKDWEREAHLDGRDYSVVGLSQLLAAQQGNVRAEEKLVAAGIATPSHVAKARSALDASRRMIPEALRRARARMAQAKADQIDFWAEAQLESRLRATESRLKEKEKLFKEGKIDQGEIWDARGDFEALCKKKKDQEERSKTDREEEHKSAQSELKLAEQLASEYLEGPPKPTAKVAKPH